MKFERNTSISVDSAAICLRLENFVFLPWKKELNIDFKILFLMAFQLRNHWKCGAVHHEFVPEGQTVNKEYYLNVLTFLREAIRRERSDFWAGNSCIFHPDNVPSVSNLIIIVAKHQSKVIVQPPYSPNLVPSDFAEGTKGHPID